MAVVRDLAKEKLALKQYQGIYKKNPTSPDEWSKLHSLAYPEAAGGLPDELKAAASESLAGTGAAVASANPLSQTVEGSNLTKLGADVEAAKEGVEKTSQPNEALRILQDAIRTKSGVMDQPLGPSKVFQEAGLTGMGSLNAALQSQTQKFQDDQTNFQNAITTMSGTYKDMATAAKNKYDISYTSYKDEVDRLQKIESELTASKRAIELAKMNHDNDIELARINAQLDPTKVAEAETAGLELTPDGYQNKNRNVITSPSGKSYNWSTYNAVGTPDEQKAYIKSVQDSINRVGKLNTITDIANYINKMAPDSVVTADDIVNISEETGVGWEELLGLLTKESETGSSNVAKKNNNFGGITWSPTYQAAHPEATKGSPRPAKEGGNYVKFATVLDGLRAQAGQFTKREVSSTQTPGFSGDVKSKAADFALKNVKAIFGGNPSEGERQAVIDFYARKVAEGITDENAILNEFIDYKINPENQVLGQNLRDVVTQNLESGKTFKEFGAKDLANLINAGKTPEAIRKVETSIYNKARVNDPDNFISESSVKLATQNVNELNALISQLDKKGKNPIGNYSGTLQSWLGKFKGSEAAEIKNKITTLVAKMRKDLSGSAVTPSEERFLQPLIPDLGDTGSNFEIKSNGLKTAPLNRLNSVRTTYGMPELNEESLIDQNKRSSIYGGGSTSKTVSSGTATSGNKFTVIKE